MSVDAARTATIWLIVVLVAAAAVLGFMLHRMAARVLAVSVLAMVVLLLIAVRVELGDIARSHHDELCAGRVDFYGIELTAAAADCPAAPTSDGSDDSDPADTIDPSITASG